MKATILMLGATALAFVPSLASAQAPGNGQYNGTGYWHTNSGNANGQPGKECGEDGPTPGNAANAPGSAFNPDGNAGTHYAGEQPQNSRNTASVSQYDTACANQSG
jgi:hypothetical protein